MSLFEILITQPIFNLLLWIYQIVGDFGVAIIVFTVFVKMAIWPITKSQLKQTKLIRDLQPEITKIRKRAKGNKTIESLETFELYRKYKVKPFRSMLSLFIQIPIFITLFSVINITVNNQEQILKFAYPATAELSRVKEITTGEEAFKPKLFGVIHLSEKAMPITSRSSIFLFIVAALSAYIQWYTIQQSQGKKSDRKLKDIMREAAEGVQADQGEINQIVSRQMSLMLPAMMFIMTINLYGALTFYYFINGLLQTIQQKIILNKKDEKSEISSIKTKNIKEAQIVKNSTQQKTNNSSNIRRIKAKDTRRKK